MCEIIRKIETGTKIQGRIVLSGYEFRAGNQHYYLFIGEKKTFCYVEVLTAHKMPINELPHKIELKEFEWPPRGAKNYLIRRFKPTDIDAAKNQMDEVRKLFGLVEPN